MTLSIAIWGLRQYFFDFCFAFSSEIFIDFAKQD